jgi:HNH endonuclease
MPKIPISLQRIVVERANYYCEYCQLPAAFSSSAFNFEHIFPLVKQGETISSNLAYSCGRCNAHKKDKTEAKDPLTQQIEPLFNPRIDKWSDHFQWSDDDLYVIGITPIGRATINRLKINRDESINLRRLLKLADLHPPKI